MMTASWGIDKYFGSFKLRGDVAKWLGSGLQIHLRRFESGRHLQLSFRKSLIHL